ncbi:hypothetical protein QBC42DRAFT_111908 [Cladorrhinum samala]|uniref:Uncharacterized protein n=1 Tax=Cladorrhinum samala TaxID=585594 RepID=A0AAV9HHT6_9PEZI|nr:hypothetical protein QBC42DRAFT_111908 [Cladorrhinum samala]
MDIAYNQHSSFRRKSRSSANLNHLSLAPLTSKLPINDVDDYETSNPFSAPPQTSSYSYLEGKSVPTTPRLLSRSPGPAGSGKGKRGTSVPASRSGTNAHIPKSKSAVHLNHHANAHKSHAASRHPNHANHKSSDRSDSDWLLRCGALISTETRESKGQAWLVSRASSTSLAGHSQEDEAFERELARERQQHSRRASRRNSVHNLTILDEDNPSSPAYSRFGSRSHSRVGSMTPGRTTSFADDYFGSGNERGAPVEEQEEEVTGPDFVNLDDKLENLELDGKVIDGLDDEVYVRRLVKGGNGGVGSWFGNVLGAKLFAVEEDEEDETEEDDEEDDYEEGVELDESIRVSSLRKLQNATMAAVDTASIPPPKADEGGWHDAAWLLTVVSKVLL